MTADFHFFEGQTQLLGSNGLEVFGSNKPSLAAINTCGFGRTRFSYEYVGDTKPIAVHFSDGNTLLRRAHTNLWMLVEGNVQTPWVGDVYVTDHEAVISAGAVADVFKLDGSHVRFMCDEIVLLVTMCGDVFEFDYVNGMLNNIKLNGKSYIQRKGKKWRLAEGMNPIYGVPSVSLQGFSFDAEEKYGYMDRYLTNGNLTTMRDGNLKFIFGVARI